MVLVGLHLGVARGHGANALVPVRHGDRDPVRLGGRGEVLLRAAPRELERVPEYAVGARPGEGALLHDGFPLGAFEDAPADRRVFAFGVLANHPEIDVALFAPGERRLDPRHQAHRAEIHVQVEAAAHRDQELPQGYVIGHAGKTAGAEEHGVVIPDRREAVFGHHAPVLQAVLAAPGKFVPLECDAEFPACGLEHAHALRHDFLADAVAGDDGDPVALHRSFTSRMRRFARP